MTPTDLIEVVYMRYHAAYIEACDSVEEALAFIESGEDYGEMSSVGVFRNAEPIIEDGYVDRKPPTTERATVMRDLYREAATKASGAACPA